ncbi:hypothetical protein [Streptomyces cellulosae]|uniref:hypothetical protein n=1 Tax=Streptomyces cellulosae TaxID=1968 RepID=UPI000B240ABF|nr:hypothetical protein [Streptomyces cellulosae]
MTTDCLSGPRERGEVMDAAKGGRGPHPDHRPTTTVPVIPLWERRRTGVRR